MRLCLFLAQNAPANPGWRNLETAWAVKRLTATFTSCCMKLVVVSTQNWASCSVGFICLTQLLSDLLLRG